MSMRTLVIIFAVPLAGCGEPDGGTFENLLATPATPLEVMTGKIVPYILIGLIQVSLIAFTAGVLAIGLCAFRKTLD